MKSIFKITLSLMLLVSVLKPHKAQAGILLTSLAAAPALVGTGIFSAFAGFGLFMAGPGDIVEDGAGTILLISIALLVADESEETISAQILESFPTITDQALSLTAKLIVDEAKKTYVTKQGFKEVILSAEQANLLVEFADFETEEESEKFYNVLTKKSLK